MRRKQNGEVEESLLFQLATLILCFLYEMELLMFKVVEIKIKSKMKFG